MAASVGANLHHQPTEGQVHKGTTYVLTRCPPGACRYAPEAVTMNDQTQTVCTVLEAERQAASAAASSKSGKKGEAEQKPKYRVQPTIKIESKVLAVRALGSSPGDQAWRSSRIPQLWGCAQSPIAM
jgi:hypothetical protein